jgi:Zn-dependent peptidase ImmA (M78 family)/transcriptional regulator with XRE-family HTH domain
MASVREENLEEARRIRRLFDPDRLRIARELRGLSKKGLADVVDLSSAAVSQFEAGHSTPNSQTLIDLADALAFPITFFAESVVDDQLDTPAFFRSLRSTTVRQQRQARAFAELVRHFAVALERLVDLPDRTIPRHPTKPDGDRRKRIERIAAAVRESWHIPADEPIPNMLQALERHGAITTRVKFDNEKMDAFSVPYDDRPVVILCADKQLKDRSRFDAAHELGHLVLHEPEDSGTRIAERQADQFAAAFLLPQVGIIDELPRRADWGRLVGLKRKWGTSMAALLYRARTLGTMTEDDYVRATKTMSARGWRTVEPEPLGAPEAPLLLHRAVNLLADEGFDLGDLSREAAISQEDVERILRASAPTKPQVEI